MEKRSESYDQEFFKLCELYDLMSSRMGTIGKRAIFSVAITQAYDAGHSLVEIQELCGEMYKTIEEVRRKNKDTQ
jgi:hypothetical protein